jgi:hypothetical protein
MGSERRLIYRPLAYRILCDAAPTSQLALLHPRPAHHQRGGARTAQSGRELRLAHNHRGYVPSAYLPRPVHPRAMLRRQPDYGRESSTLIGRRTRVPVHLPDRRLRPRGARTRLLTQSQFPAAISKSSTICTAACAGPARSRATTFAAICSGMTAPFFPIGVLV